MRLVNLVRNPRPVGTTGFRACSYQTEELPSLSVAGEVMTVTSNADMTGSMQEWVQTVVETVPGTRYVFSAYLQAGSSASYPMQGRVLAVESGASIAGSAAYSRADMRYTVEFDASGSSSTLRLYAPSVSGEQARYSHLVCCTKRDRDTLDGLGLVYFDYSTMPCA